MSKPHKTPLPKPMADEYNNLHHLGEELARGGQGCLDPRQRKVLADHPHAPQVRKADARPTTCPCPCHAVPPC